MGTQIRDNLFRNAARDNRITRAEVAQEIAGLKSLKVHRLNEAELWAAGDMYRSTFEPGARAAFDDFLLGRARVLMSRRPSLAEKLGGALGIKRDTDGDGLSDAEEKRRGTNPFSADTDRDGWTDEAEVARGSDAGRMFPR